MQRQVSLSPARLPLGEAATTALHRAGMAGFGKRVGPLAVLLAACLGCGESAPESVTALDTRPGYPATTSRLGTSLGDDLLRACLATLVHPAWALTAAHCFSGVEPESRGTLRDFARGFSADEVEFFPGAHESGATRLGAVWQREDFVAARDLALVPLRPPLDEIAPVAAWQPRDECALSPGERVIGELGLEGRGGEALTAEAAILGPVEAAVLLGAGHTGWLLAAQGPRVGPGDSGSGMTAAWHALEPAAPHCEPLGPAVGQQVLVGVVQDANPVDPSARFGLVPVFGSEPAHWLKSVLDATPAPFDPRPPQLFP